MEKRVKNDCQTEGLILDLKTRRSPRFKAGSDLSTKVNLVSIDLNEEVTEHAELFELKLEVKFERCVQEECA